MKALNQRIFEEVLEPMFPGEFEMGGGYVFEKEGEAQANLSFEAYLVDAFWLAEKIGLFEDYVLSRPYMECGSWEIVHRYDESIFFVGREVAEAICLAVLEIYGKKK